MVLDVPDVGSRIFVRLVALSTPAPTRTMMPTTIHVAGILSKYAAPASPTMRIKYPMRYVANDDIISGFTFRMLAHQAKAEP